jgi:ThiF family
MRIVHTLSNIDSPYRRTLRVLLIGSGGNGSAVLFGLPYLHRALEAWGRPEGIDVTVMDGDAVSPTNCVRQPFGAADIGHNKATILVNRINLFHGLAWRSDTLHCGGISVYPAFVARKVGHGNDRVWKSLRIATFPQPRRLDICFLVPPQLKPSPPQGACNGCLRSTT